MAVSSHLPVDRTLQIQIADNGCGAQVEIACGSAARISESGTTPVPKLSTCSDTGLATPIT